MPVDLHKKCLCEYVYTPQNQPEAWRIKLELTQRKLMPGQGPATENSLLGCHCWPWHCWTLATTLQDSAALGHSLLAIELSTQWPRLIISNWTFAIVSPLKDHASPRRGNICSPFGFIDSAFSPCRGKGGGGWCRQKHSFKWKVPILFLKRLTFVQTVKKWKQKQSNLHSSQFSEYGFH